jgi:outer membrane protein assembly factor BamB
VHVLLNLQDGTIRDLPFNTLTNTFLATKILSSGNPVVSGGYVGTSGISSLISSQGTLHVAYWSPDNHITYAGYSYDIQTDILTQISGSTQLDGSESSNNNHPSLAISPVDGTITVAWVSGTNGAGNIWSKTTNISGVWGNAEKVNTSAAWTSPDSGINIDQGPSLIVTTDGTRQLVYIQNWTVEAPYDYGKIHYVTNAGSGWVDQYIGAYTHNPALALNTAGNLVIIGHGMVENQTCKDLNTVCYWQKVSDSSWSEFILLPASTSATFDSSPSVKWSVIGWNRPESIEAVIPNVVNGYSNSSLYYVRIDTETPLPTPVITSTPTLVPSPTFTPAPTPTEEPTNTPTLIVTATPQLTLTPTSTPTPVPPTATPTSGPLSSEWTQHAFNAEHTSYNPTSIPTPWKWKWSWNGPNTTGGLSTGKTTLPRNVQPVTGNGNVYVARGANGVIALNSTNGSTVWSVSPGGNINSTVAYDNDTDSVFAVSSNGTLYKLNAADGVTLSSFSSSGTSSLPLPPSVYGDAVFFSMGSNVYAINKNTMQQIWSYNAASLVDTPPAYSSTRNSIIVGSEDLYVHAINNINGTQLWRVKPSVRSAGNPDSSSSNNLAEFKRGWPVIAEVHGYVLMKARLDWQTLWDMYTGSPDDNTYIHTLLTQNPDKQALFVLDLDDGTIPFIANSGHGGYGNGGYMPMGYQPVVKQYDNGQEFVYIIARGFAVGDSRWDSHFAELVLDSTSVPGYSAGYYRYVDYTGGTTNSKGDTFLTDEQPFLSMAGNDLFGNHWEATMHNTRITDRSNTLGSYTNPIKSQQLPTMIESQDGGGCNNTTHFKTGLLQSGRTYPNLPGGFHIYCGLGAIYDEYWSDYATTIVSNNLLIVRSIDGAIVALENGTP